MPLVFQYGSNCDTQRLNSPERLNGAAEYFGTAQTVEKYLFAFNKWSTKGKCAAADLIKRRKGGRRIWGVVFQISRAGFKKMKEEIEGPSYRPQNILVKDGTGAILTVKTFRVRLKRRSTGLYTSAAYVGHIVRGLRSHGVPEDYVQSVIETAIKTNNRAKDQDPAQRENALIESLP